MDRVFFIGAIVLFILVGPWVLVWRTSISRRREREEDGERSRRLESRISALELTVRKLQTQQPAPPMDVPAAKPAERPVAAEHTATIPALSTTGPPVWSKNSCSATVVFQQAAEAFSTANGSTAPNAPILVRREEQEVVLTLVIPLCMIVLGVLS